MSILANLNTQSNLPSIIPDTDRNLLLLLLEKLVSLIERLWREEVKRTASGESDTPWQAALRNTHRAVAELRELAADRGTSL